MTREKDDMEVFHGSGNVFRDVGFPNADVEQAKALLAAEIIRVLRVQKLTNRAAQKITGVRDSDFSRIRKPDLGRFTIDRLMTILNKLERDVDINMEFRRRSKRKGQGAQVQTHV